MKPRTFAEIYCAQRGLPATEYHQRLFREALYPHARLVAGWLRLMHRRYFVADCEFVEDVGHLTSVADFALTMGSYVEHPDNRGLLRRRLQLRVSARRMLRLVRGLCGHGSGAAAGRARPRHVRALHLRYFKEKSSRIRAGFSAT